MTPMPRILFEAGEESSNAELIYRPRQFRMHVSADHDALFELLRS